MIDQIGFRESCDKWCDENYPNCSNEIKSVIGNIFELLYDELKINTSDANILDIKKIIDIDQLSIEKSFYDIFIELRKKKSNNTINSFVCISRKALFIMGMKKERLKIPAKTEKETKDYLPIELRKLSENSPVIIFINSRIDNANKCFNLKSQMTKKIMLRYWVNILSCFGCLENLDINNIDFSLNNIVETVKHIITSNYYIIYLHHFFYKINDEWNIKLKELKPYFNNIKKTEEDNDGDKDFLTAIQQENILKACNSSFEKLIILLLFTTGMRVGGLSNIKKNDIYDKETNTIKDYGITIEKRNKTRKFPVFEIIKRPLSEWLEETHMIDNIYLFPSPKNNLKPRSTMYFQTLFKEIAKRAGYEGTEIHIHSCRHSVARNLLEAGNKMEDIGKFLGHTNPTTTAKFYANLSVKETIDRMNTECIGGYDKKSVHVPQIPNFREKEIHKKKKNKLSKLKNIQIGESSINEDYALKMLEKARMMKK